MRFGRDPDISAEGRSAPRWPFEAAASFYAWMTAQTPWRQSCRALVAHLPSLERPLRIVDLGCGPGVAAFELARRRPQDVVSGVDIAGRMLRRARRDAVTQPSIGRRLTWIQADATEMPIKAESVDVVIGHSVLYLLPDAGGALRECRRILRPGGRLIVMEPSDRPLKLRGILRVSRDPRFLLSVALWRPASWLHRRYNQVSLTSTLRRAGFMRCHVSDALSGLGLIACAERL
jgi:ubiquinone/menaquinone biosynthesis C-methylase UbiE